jgi:hypothetical protein
MVGVLLASTALAVVAVSITAVPARAGGFEVYSCKSCSQQNGKEVLASEAMKAIGRVEGAKGVCAAVWRWLGSSWQEYLECTATGTETSAVTGFVGAFEGHGQVRRYYKEFLYNLWGEEQWI